MPVHPAARGYSLGLMASEKGTSPDVLLLACHGAPSGGTLVNGQEMAATQRALCLRDDGTAATTIYATVNGGTNWTAFPVAGPDFGAAGIQTDVIAESTGAAGVTIDGILLKDDIITFAAGVGHGIALDSGASLTDLAGGASAYLTSTGTMIIDDEVVWGDPADTTKRARIDAGNVTAGQTRVITAADFDIDLANATLVATGTIATAAVKTLNATPVQVIASPGAGKYIEVLSCEWFLDFNSAAYDGAAAGDTLVLRYTDGAGVTLTTAVPGNTIGSAAADYRTWVSGLAGPQIPAVAAAVVAHITTGEWFVAAGDSPLKYSINYRIRTAIT